MLLDVCRVKQIFSCCCKPVSEICRNKKANTFVIGAHFLPFALPVNRNLKQHLQTAATWQIFIDRNINGWHLPVKIWLEDHASLFFIRVPIGPFSLVTGFMNEWSSLFISSTVSGGSGLIWDSLFSKQRGLKLQQALVVYSLALLSLQVVQSILGDSIQLLNYPSHSRHLSVLGRAVTGVSLWLVVSLCFP